MSESHGVLDNSFTFTEVEPRKFHCVMHGDHPRWISLYGYGENMPAYCMDCILSFLDKQSIGKVYIND